MKAQIIPYPPPPREVVVTMSEEEASELYGGVKGSVGNNVWGALERALHAAGVR